jgi:hypothetical protein
MSLPEQTRTERGPVNRFVVCRMVARTIESECHTNENSKGERRICEHEKGRLLMKSAGRTSDVTRYPSVVISEGYFLANNIFNNVDPVLPVLVDYDAIQSRQI